MPKSKSQNEYTARMKFAITLNSERRMIKPGAKFNFDGKILTYKGDKYNFPGFKSIIDRSWVVEADAGEGSKKASKKAPKKESNKKEIKNSDPLKESKDVPEELLGEEKISESLDKIEEFKVDTKVVGNNDTNKRKVKVINQDDEEVSKVSDDGNKGSNSSGVELAETEESIKSVISHEQDVVKATDYNKDKSKDKSKDKKIKVEDEGLGVVVKKTGSKKKSNKTKKESPKSSYEKELSVDKKYETKDRTDVTSSTSSEGEVKTVLDSDSNPVSEKVTNKDGEYRKATKVTDTSKDRAAKDGIELSDVKVGSSDEGMTSSVEVSDDEFDVENLLKDI